RRRRPDRTEHESTRSARRVGCGGTDSNIRRQWTSCASEPSLNNRCRKNSLSNRATKNLRVVMSAEGVACEYLFIKVRHPILFRYFSRVWTRTPPKSARAG